MQSFMRPRGGATITLNSGGGVVETAISLPHWHAILTGWTFVSSAAVVYPQIRLYAVTGQTTGGAWLVWQFTPTTQTELGVITAPGRDYENHSDIAGANRYTIFAVVNNTVSTVITLTLHGRIHCAHC